MFISLFISSICQTKHKKCWARLRGRREIGERNSNNLRYAAGGILLIESNNNLKQLLMKVKEGNAKVGLHLNIKKTKIMTRKEIHKFNIDNEDNEIVKDFAYLGSVISSQLMKAVKLEAVAKKSRGD